MSTRQTVRELARTVSRGVFGAVAVFGASPAGSAIAHRRHAGHARHHHIGQHMAQHAHLPAARHAHLPTAAIGVVIIVAVVAAMVIGVGALLYRLAVALRKRPWPFTIWTLRLAILAEALFVWVVRNRLLPIGFAAAASCLALLVFLHHIARRHALGWTIDQDGERQKVDHWVRGQAIYSPTTWWQRIIEEGQLRDGRRAVLGWSLLAAVPIGAGAWWIWREHPGHPFAAGALAVVAGLIAVFLVVPNLFIELVYLAGYQDMPGHQVRDAQVHQPDKYDVAQEMAHGDASLAGEHEALGFLQKGR